MELLHSVSGPFKTFLGPDPVASACQWVSFAVVHTADQAVLLTRILVALSFRLLFGAWPKSLNVVPFRICPKDSYYEDAGVVEMRAMLQGRDGFDFHLDQQQKLPFPPPEYDPYDKVYLASYYHSLVRTVCDAHTFFVEYGGPVYEKFNDVFLVQKAVNFISTRVAVNIE